jgi:hypothetical protein
MAVETLTSFPNTLIAGDTLRVSHSNSKYPSSDWSLKVSIQGATVTKVVDAEANDDDDGYGIVFPASVTALLKPAGVFAIRLIYTETDGGERATDEDIFFITVLSDPASASAKSIARQTLEAMEAALLKLAGGSNAIVNFNGRGFTKRNLPELQKAIQMQRAIVATEDRRRTGDTGPRRILNKV